jgi:hypothetical protein
VDSAIPQAVEEAAVAWDQGAADAALAQINARLDRALAPGGKADTDGRRRAIEAYRRAVAAIVERRDPYLFKVLQDLEAGLFARWRAEDEERTKRLSPKG